MATPTPTTPGKVITIPAKPTFDSVKWEKVCWYCFNKVGVQKCVIIIFMHSFKTFIYFFPQVSKLTSKQNEIITNIGKFTQSRPIPAKVITHLIALHKPIFLFEYGFFISWLIIHWMIFFLSFLIIIINSWRNWEMVMSNQLVMWWRVLMICANLMNGFLLLNLKIQMKLLKGLFFFFIFFYFKKNDNHDIVLIIIQWIFR